VGPLMCFSKYLLFPMKSQGETGTEHEGNYEIVPSSTIIVIPAATNSSCVMETERGRNNSFLPVAWRRAPPASLHIFSTSDHIL